MRVQETAPNGAVFNKDRLRAAKQAKSRMVGNAETAAAVCGIAEASIRAVANALVDEPVVKPIIDLATDVASKVDELTSLLADFVSRTEITKGEAIAAVERAENLTAAVSWQRGGEVPPEAHAISLRATLDTLTSDITVMAAENDRLTIVVGRLEAEAAAAAEARSFLMIVPDEPAERSAARVEQAIRMYGRTSLARFIGQIGSAASKRLEPALFDVTEEAVESVIDRTTSVVGNLLHDGLRDPAVVSLWRKSLANQIVSGLVRTSTPDVSKESIVVEGVSRLYGMAENPKLVEASNRTALKLIGVVSERCFGIAVDDLPDDVTASSANSLPAVLGSLIVQIALAILPAFSLVASFDDSPPVTPETSTAEPDFTNDSPESADNTEPTEDEAGNGIDTTGEPVTQAEESSDEPWFMTIAEMVMPEAGATKSIGKIRFNLDGSGYTHTAVASAQSQIVEYLKANHASVLKNATNWKLQSVVNGTITGFGALSV